MMVRRHHFPVKKHTHPKNAVYARKLQKASESILLLMEFAKEKNHQQKQKSHQKLQKTLQINTPS